MSRYCLDTVAYSHIKRGEGRIVRMPDRADWIGVPVIVIGGIMRRVREGVEGTENLDELAEVLASAMVGALPVDRQIAENIRRDD